MDSPLHLNAPDPDGPPRYDAGILRRGMAGLVMPDGRPVSGRQGIRPGGLSVTLGAGGVITVHPGLCYIDPGITTTQSGYWCCVAVDESPGSVAAADATNPRRDILIVEVLDDDVDDTGSRLARVRYIQGVAAAAPQAPETPQSSLRLGVIDVPRAGGGSPVWTPDNRYTVASGGILPVGSQSERDALVGWPGLRIWRTDRGWAETMVATAPAQWRVEGIPTCTTQADLAAITSPYLGQLAVTTTPVPVVVQRGPSGWQPLATPRLVMSAADQPTAPSAIGVSTIAFSAAPVQNYGFAYASPYSSFSIPVDGLYDFTLQGQYGVSTGGHERRLHCTIGGTTYTDGRTPLSGDNTALTAAWRRYVTAGTTVSFGANQDSGGSLAFTAIYASIVRVP